MANIIELTSDQQKSLEHDATEVTQDELQTLIDKRGEEWKKTPTGQSIIALLQKKDVAQASTSDATQKALEAEKDKNAKLQQELEVAKKSKDKPSEEISLSTLPYAPTTAFNMVRLAQLGFFPTDYSESLAGEWSKLTKWQKVRK